MIVKTTGIALRHDPFSRTSETIVWLTPDHGRVVTLAKGAKRVRNAFLGQYDVFYTCEILFYSSPRSSLHLLKECAPITIRERFRSDWRACVGASYFADLLNRMTVAGDAHAQLFTFAIGILDFCNDHGFSRGMMFWSELNLFKLLGVTPRLKTCLSCGRGSVQSGTEFFMSLSRGGLLCQDCKTVRDGSVFAIAPDVLAMMRAWLSAPSPLVAKNTSYTSTQARMVDDILSGFLRYHLDTSSVARGIASLLLC